MPKRINGKKRKASDAGDTRRKKRRMKKKKMKVFVVDEHNDAMLPFLDAVKNGQLPKKGVKMLHYDSHPDLGNISKGDKIIEHLAKGKVDKTGLHKMTDIATWITPLCLAGFCDEVIWVAGHWCPQIEEGTYELVCGIDSKKALKTASADGDNENNDAVTDYWECDGTSANLKKLKHCKTWKLHVFKHNKKGELPDESFWEIVEIIGNNPWVLDIDEDFFSCNNPHRDDFSACFGMKNWQLLRKIYDVGQPHDEGIEKFLKNKQFLQSQSKFLKLKPVKSLLKVLKEEGHKDPKKLIQDFRKLLIDHYQKEYPDGVNIEELFNLDDLHTAGLYSNLPHHLTKVKDIVEMGNSIEELLNEFIKKENNPIHVTLATSRADRYLPDCQAAIIHGMLDVMMEAIYKDVNIIRMDKPEFSINFATDDEDSEE